MTAMIGNPEDFVGLGIDRCSCLHIDYLRPTPIEEHGLLVIELTIRDPDFMVLVSNNLKAELSI
jgi:hypothetical protein